MSNDVISNFKNNLKATIVFIAQTNPAYLEDLYKSIKFFTHTPYNLIIIDNQTSRDNNNFFSQVDDCLILVPKTNLSLPQVANYAFDKVETPYVVYFHKGEALICGHFWLRDIILFMESNTDVGLAGDVRFPGIQRIESILKGKYDNSRLQPNWINTCHANLHQISHVQGGAMVIRTSMARKIGWFNENYKNRLMDVEYSLRAMSRGYKLGKIPFILSPQPGYTDALPFYRAHLHRVINIGDFIPLRKKLRRQWENYNINFTADTLPLMTVIIGVRNRDLQLQFSLRTLIDQTLPKNLYEIIIVNYGGENDEKTRQLVEFIDPDIRYIYTHEKGIWCNAKARNIGVLAAKSKLICFVNPDGLFGQNLLKEILKIHESYPKGALVQGRRYDLTTELTKNILNGKFDADLRSIFQMAQYRLHRISAEGDCQSFPKETYIAIGGYDEDYNGWGADDNDFSERIVRFGLPKVWLNHNKCRLLHLHHRRDYTNKHQNKQLFFKRKGQIIRNVGKEWGQIREKPI